MSTIKSSAENLTLNADGANNDIKFQSNGSEVASIDQAGVMTATSFAVTTASFGTIGKVGNTANDVNIYSTTAGHNGLRMHVNGILPTDNTGTIVDADADLGDPSYRFKTLYLSGGVAVGGTGAANTLEDYEEGTYTSLNATSGDNISSVSHSTAYYTKIGRLVTLSFSITGTIASATAETNLLFNLPFTAIDAGNSSRGGTVNFLMGSGASRFGIGLVFNGSSGGSTNHIYIPASQMNASGSTNGNMHVQMTYMTN